MGDALAFVIDGPIVATARARIVHGRAMTPRATVEYQARVSVACRAAMAAACWPERPRGPFVVAVSLNGPSSMLADVDGDNVGKGVLDALVKAGAVFDDRMRCVRAVGVSWDRLRPEAWTSVRITPVPHPTSDG